MACPLCYLATLSPSFLPTVPHSALPISAVTQPAGGGIAHPWLHPVFFLDIGAPNRTEALIERYRLPHPHKTYLRPFERGVVLYNPEATPDTHIPLDGHYTDPWSASCAVWTHWPHLDGNSGMILVRL